MLWITGETVADEFIALKEKYQQYDFIYIHIKKTDSYDEDGNYDAKVKVLRKLIISFPG